ncbi:hypothetical protein B0O80DRAFT_246645 [Mortierella sp. GBAus27b]|nr:hypothetical protein BGX31_005720 [Mortierella sp. GBA43]KAI8346245.1 hypothetical protein B0O80DRAFT_246645 [Mortierella sp. GBAus27b]
MATPQAKEQREAIKATLKAIEQDYKNKVRVAEKKCANLRKEAEQAAELERAKIKAAKDKADKEAKDEYQMVKQEAKEAHIKLVMDLIKNVILDIKSKNLELDPGYYSHGGTLGRSSSTSSAGSSSSSAAKEDAEIKEWVEYAAERLEVHMNKNLGRQRLLEEVATGALIRQHQAQQEAMRRTEELERQLQQLQLLHQQHQQGDRTPASQGPTQGQDMPPPTYASSVGIDSSDYSVLGIKDKKEPSS